MKRKAFLALVLFMKRIVFYDHPSGYDRVRMTMMWKSEHLQDP